MRSAFGMRAQPALSLMTGVIVHHMIRAFALLCQQPGSFVLSLSKHERAVPSAPLALRQAQGERREGLSLHQKG